MAGMERDTGDFSPAEAASALAWWTEAGVDTIVSEAPRNWLNPQTAAPVPAAAPEAAPAPAGMPNELEAFQAWFLAGDAFPAAPSAARLGPTGEPSAGLAILIDMPSVEDLAAGTLLSGETGRLFDRMLAAIGRDRSSIYLSPLSPVRIPAGALDPANAAAAAEIARHHLGLVAPKAALLFGDGCARALLGGGVAETRGKWHEIRTPRGNVRVLATISPELLLRNPAWKALAWADLQLLMEALP